jgi:DNA (cytosine-5)-methyltransferase 1
VYVGVRKMAVGRRQTMRELSLFSGAGGGLLGTHLLGWRPVGYVEWNDYCQRVIAARIRDGILPNAPIFGDVNTFNSEGYAAAYTGMVDVVTGGFPCQPFSLAGKRQGSTDERNGWPATMECLRIVRPRYALLENVPGILSSGYFGTILGDLAESGFDCRWRVLSATEMGAPHKRDRLWIVAHARSSRCSRPNPVQSDRDKQRHDSTPEQSGFAKSCITIADREDAANANQSRLAIRNGSTGKRGTRPTIDGCSWWAVEPALGRVANGVAARVDRLTALGNGQVPAVVRAAWMLML